MKSKNKYFYPVDISKFKINYKDSPAHKGRLKYSVDFIVPQGTPVYAAAKGEIVWIRNNSKKGGPFKKYWLKGNRIVIKHKNKEYTAYEHLKYKSSLVKLGDNVKKGQLIAYSGNTGYSFCPHLHFEVFHNPCKDKSEGETLQISWLSRGKIKFLS